MKHQGRRGLLAAMGAAAVGGALALGGAVAANAATGAQPVPTASTVTITKCEQPAELGDPATGLPDAGLCADNTGIEGVTFDYYLVTGTGVDGAKDIGTNEGQIYAAGLTVNTAPIGDTETGSFDATSASGVTTKVLPRGLYVVKEASAPAGVTPSLPFLLAVPMTDPDGLETWLDTIYVYPKNAKITATKGVENAESYVVGDDVTWTINAGIPRNPNPNYGESEEAPQFIAPDSYQIWDTLTDAELTTTIDQVNVTAPADLIKGEDGDYTVELVENENDTTTVKVIFTPAGLAKLATAVNDNADAVVTVTIETEVMASGVIENAAQIFPNEDSLPGVDDEGNPLSTNDATIQYGEFDVVKSSTKTGADLDGAQFRVYNDLDEAKAASDKYLTPSTNNTGLWTTDEDGKLTIDGLRDSDFADGEGLEEGATAYVTYYLVEVKALDGHQLYPEPIPVIVTQDTADVQVTNVANEGGFVLPLTGGMGTLILTVGGLALLALVLMVARRRRALETVE